MIPQNLRGGRAHRRFSVTFGVLRHESTLPGQEFTSKLGRKSAPSSMMSYDSVQSSTPFLDALPAPSPPRTARGRRAAGERSGSGESL